MTDLATDPTPFTAVPQTGRSVPIGRVAAPPEHESTSDCFYFWVDRSQSVERTQIVTTESSVAGRTVRFVGIVQEVYRRSRQKDIGEEQARFDGRCAETPPFDSEGVTYAEVAILRTDKMQSAMSSGKQYYVASPFRFRKAGQSGADMAKSRR